MEEQESKTWVAVVYDGQDKINSRIFRGSEEEIVRPEALKWVTELYGQGTDWSLHEINR